MQKRNVTLALPRELLRDAKLLAAERGTSISAMVSELLREQVARRRRLAGARKRHLASLSDPPDLGTGGRAPWRRDELHER